MVVLLKEDIDAFLNGGASSGSKKLQLKQQQKTDAETTAAPVAAIPAGAIS